ncbi:helix-turn-helix domain-containing protein [Micromonospora sp. NPDC004551]|uniref:helix-turn-helix domain-containing protein n=1 Tax=Micromonospora sp. NPDC004551 TaxID=3154284 RepID=UPI0033ABAC32
MDHGEYQLDRITDPAGFLAALRTLKERSGLTYRQLAQRAAGNGDVLARSTIADVLNRDTLPRPEVVAAFVRACGQGDLVAAWLHARDRLAVAALVPAPPAPGSAPSASDPTRSVPGTAPPPPGPEADAGGPTPPSRPDPAPGGRGRNLVRGLLALAAVAVTVAVGTGVWLATPGSGVGDDPPVARTATSTGAAPPAGRVRIRPARTPQLCLSEGRDRTGAYRSEILVQRLCEGATPPETFLEPVGDGYFLTWRHPVKGSGCLTVRGDSPGMFLLEPWDDCDARHLEQVFRFEASTDGAYRIRSAREGLCLGIRDDTTAPAEAALAEPCADRDDQLFLVDPLGPAATAATG